MKLRQQPAAHEALALVRELVALLERHPAAKQYVGLISGAADLERRARRLAASPLAKLDPRAALVHCALCGCYHIPLDEIDDAQADRLVPRSALVKAEHELGCHARAREPRCGLCQAVKP